MRKRLHGNNKRGWSQHTSLFIFLSDKFAHFLHVLLGLLHILFILFFPQRECGEVFGLSYCVGFDVRLEQVPCLPACHITESALPHLIAFDDSSHLPECNLIQKLTTGESDFAHDQLIDVVSVCQFFLPFPFSSFSGFSDDGSLYQSL